MPRRSKGKSGKAATADLKQPQVVVVDGDGSPPTATPPAALPPEEDLRVYLAECDQAMVDVADDDVL